MANIEISQDLLREHFDYKDGELYWKKKLSRYNTVAIGSKAGGITHRRYKIAFGGKQYYTSRLIFLFHKGYLPKEIDHIDQNPLNNHIENLRECTRTENMRNRSSFKNSTSQYFGVSSKKKTNKYTSKVTGEIRISIRVGWVVQIQINKIKKEVGFFTDEIKAALSYNKAAVKHFGEFAHLNIIQPEK